MVEYNLGKVRGEDGKGIESIVKTSTTDNIDTYTILYTNGEETTFTVTNGRDGTVENIDDNVTQNSENPVKSSGIYTALTGKANNIHTHSISDVTNLQTGLDGKVNTSDIVDNLTTNDATKVLSAKQGKALADLIGTAINYINL